MSHLIISMARSVGGQDGSIPTLRLATRADKMELSCRSGLPTLTVSHKKKFSQKPYKKILYWPNLLAFHTASAREIWIGQSGFRGRKKLYPLGVKLTRQERHWNQATFLTGNCFKYARKGIYNFKNHARLLKVNCKEHFESPSFYFSAKNGPPAFDMAIRSWFVECRKVRHNSCDILNTICYSSSNSTRNSQVNH